MSKALKINKGINEGVVDLLEHLIQSGEIKAVFTLKKLNDKGAVAYSLISSVDELKKAVPFYPLMPVNAGKVLSSFTLWEATEEPVAAVLRPCELKAFVELVKRTQGSLDNILVISSTCGGVYPLRSLENGNLEKNQNAYWESVKKAENDPNIRITCQGCVDFFPQTADMTVASLGKEVDKETLIFLNTDKGEKFSADAPGNITEAKEDEDKIEKFKKLREEKKSNLYKEFESQQVDAEALVKTFAPCLGCHACSHVCPICFCTLCDFESKTIEPQPHSFSSELSQKDGIKVPPGNIFFHLGRMTHMAVSCIRCGMCSDVCPVNIPVATIFSKVGESVQKVFEYVPGRDVEEPAPTGTYKEEEFAKVGEQ
jgi:formate dehydrogenase (coenzyme F420) beta subunit